MAAKNEMIRKEQKHKVKNWPDYNVSLKKRGSLEIWISDDIEELWYEKDTINDGTGKPKKYTEKSIELSYFLKLAFKQPLRQTEGFVKKYLKWQEWKLNVQIIVRYQDDGYLPTLVQKAT